MLLCYSVQLKQDVWFLLKRWKFSECFLMIQIEDLERMYRNHSPVDEASVSFHPGLVDKHDAVSEVLNPCGNVISNHRELIYLLIT